MSRAKAKLAIIHDLQGKQNDVVLTKKDCDMIADALLAKYTLDDIEAKNMYFYFKDLGKL